MPKKGIQKEHLDQLGQQREPGPAYAAMKRTKKVKIVKYVLKKLKKQQPPGAKDWVVDPAKAYDIIRERVFLNELPERSAQFVVGFSTDGRFSAPGRLNGGYNWVWRNADGTLR